MVGEEGVVVERMAFVDENINNDILFCGIVSIGSAFVLGVCEMYAHKVSILNVR